MSSKPNLNTLYEAAVLFESLPAGSDELVAAIQDYECVVIYTLAAVTVEKATSVKKLPDDMLELRAFNQSGELHLVVVEGKRVGRICTDNAADGEACWCFDEEHLIWGAPQDGQSDGSLRLMDDRGTNLILPLSADGTSKDSLVTILVRNYAQGDEQSSDLRFCDYRLIEFSRKDVV